MSLATAGLAHNTVILVGADAVWPSELLKLLNPEEWKFILVGDLEDLPPRLAQGNVQAVILTPCAWSGRELLLLSECRRRSPETALVIMGEDPVAPRLKRAFEQGATAFLRWPASPEAVLHAIRSGNTAPPAERSRPQ
jgi:DNA-binding NtrC family response regulator